MSSMLKLVRLFRVPNSSQAVIPLGNQDTEARDSSGRGQVGTVVLKGESWEHLN